MRRCLTFALLVAAALTFSQCKPAVADAAPAITGGLTVGVIAMSADSLTVRAQWDAYTDGAGPAESYLDTVLVGSSLVHAKSTIATADTFTVHRPAAGATISLTFHIRAVRRSKVGAAGVLAWNYTQQDVAPGAPGGIRIDTLAIVLPASRVVAVVPSGFSCLPGDSAKLRAVALAETGDTLTPTGSIVWVVADTCRQAVHPISGTAQAWGICKVRPELSGTQPIVTASCA